MLRETPMSKVDDFTFLDIPGEPRESDRRKVGCSICSRVFETCSPQARLCGLCKDHKDMPHLEFEGQCPQCWAAAFRCWAAAFRAFAHGLWIVMRGKGVR